METSQRITCLAADVVPQDNTPAPAAPLQAGKRAQADGAVEAEEEEENEQQEDQVAHEDEDAPAQAEEEAAETPAPPAKEKSKQKKKKQPTQPDKTNKRPEQVKKHRTK